MKDLLGLSKSESFIRTRAQYLYTFEISMNAQRDLMVRRAGGNCCSDKYALQMLVWVLTFPMSGRSCGGLQSLVVCFWFAH
jgi:hypothetical protein